MFADTHEPEVMVLLSGGLDSTACVNFFLRMGRTPTGLFIDYGQRTAAREWQAVQDVTSFYNIPVARVQWQGSDKTAGLILGRNAFLITAALMEKPASVSIIATGIHAGTGYADCSPAFVSSMQAVLDTYEEAHVQLAALFLDWTKVDIVHYCLMDHVPIDLTYSSERGSEPCGDCLSCKDRKLIDVTARSNNSLSHEIALKVDLPLLIPAFSSKGFLLKKRQGKGHHYTEVVNDLAAFAERNTTAALVSAYDLHFKHFDDAPKLPPISGPQDYLRETRLVFLDSGRYELIPDFDRTEFKTFAYGPKKGYGLEQYKKVLENLTALEEHEATNVLEQAVSGLQHMVEQKIAGIRLGFAHDLSHPRPLSTVLGDLPYRPWLVPRCQDLLSALWFQFATLIADRRPLRNCGECGLPYVGRKGKKTCSDSCRQRKSRRLRAKTPAG